MVEDTAEPLARQLPKNTAKSGMYYMFYALCRPRAGDQTPEEERIEKKGCRGTPNTPHQYFSKRSSQSSLTS